MKKFFTPLLLLMATTFTFTACYDDDDDFSGINPAHNYEHGTFVLNEGNMGDGNGTLTFISNDGVVTDSAYYKENGSFLGNVSEDLWIEDDFIYIISQNGNKNGGDGLLVVADAKTLKKQVAFNEELKDLAPQWPTHIAVEDNRAYIRANNGINLFNLTTHELKQIPGTEGAAKNRMVEINDEIYAAAGDKILVVNNEAVVRTIQMEGVISGILETDDDNLWVACKTTPAQICKVDAKRGTIIEKHELAADLGLNENWGVSPAISAKGNLIYFSNGTTKIYCHDFSQNKTDLMTDVATHVADAKVVYNNLGVHPQTGEVYFNTLKDWSEYLVNDITVFNFKKQEAPVANYKNHTAFPVGFFFTASF